MEVAVISEWEPITKSRKRKNCRNWNRKHAVKLTKILVRISQRQRAFLYTVIQSLGDLGQSAPVIQFTSKSKMKRFLVTFNLLLANSLSMGNDHRVADFTNDVKFAKCVALITNVEIRFLVSKKIPTSIKIPNNINKNLSSLIIYRQEVDGSSKYQEFPVMQNHVVILPNKDSDSIILIKLEPLKISLNDATSALVIKDEHITRSEGRTLFHSNELPKRLASIEEVGPE